MMLNSQDDLFKEETKNADASDNTERKEVIVRDEKAEFSKRFNMVLDYLDIAPKQKCRQVVVAKMFSVSQKGARKWLEGEAIPESKRIPEFIERLKSARITGEWLFHGNPLYAPDWIAGKNGRASNLKPGPDLKRTVPLLSGKAAVQWQETMRNIESDTPWVQTTADVGPQAYAMIMMGDSMTNPHGSPSIPHGYTVIIDPEVEPVSGSIVAARIDDHSDVILKMLVIDGPKRYLKALNSAYPVIEIDDSCVFCGTVKKVSFDL